LSSPAGSFFTSTYTALILGFFFSLSASGGGACFSGALAGVAFAFGLATFLTFFFLTIFFFFEREESLEDLLEDFLEGWWLVRIFLIFLAS